MKLYRVHITEPAEADIDTAFQYLLFRNAPAAYRFREGLTSAIRSLEELPHRCSVAQESRFFQRGVRQLNFLHGKTSYRILFTVVESEEKDGSVVSILRIRHGALSRLGDEISEEVENEEA